ncbi:ion transporter [Oligoflexia bacterium]|nr:ion transporter [Oligoflexia bacterium]
MTTPQYNRFDSSWRNRLHEIIFEADTPEGKLFDIVLLWAIVLSVSAVLLESVASIEQHYGPILRCAEWIFTILFTVEYIVRIICVAKPTKYIFSFFGIVDLLAVVPTYVSLFIAGSQYLLVIRALRLLRVFRVLKLGRYLGEAEVLMNGLRRSRPKIIVFIGGIFTIVVIAGAVLYLVEGQENGFTSVPKSMYWAIVTLTTVGYGDITPQTTFGQALSALLMILGYAILAVPAGIVSSELTKAQGEISTQACLDCGRGGHDIDAKYCRFCGGKL